MDAILVGLGCRGDDASQGARLRPFEEKCRKQEWCQVIDRPGQLDTVLAQLPGRVHGAGVVHEHVQLQISATGKVDVIVEPVPWRPTRDAKCRSRIVAEHRRRYGDTAAGGSTREPIITAYRHQALARAAARPRDLRVALPDVPKILLRNVYGWFVRVERGIYTLSEGGKAALVRWKAYLPANHRPQGGRPSQPLCSE